MPLHFQKHNFIYLACVYVHTGIPMHTYHSVRVEVRGQCRGFESLLPMFGSQGLNSGSETWQQMPSPAEPSQSPHAPPLFSSLALWQKSLILSFYETMNWCLAKKQIQELNPGDKCHLRKIFRRRHMIQPDEWGWIPLQTFLYLPSPTSQKRSLGSLSPGRQSFEKVTTFKLLHIGFLPKLASRDSVELCLR